ncbi:AMIN-like domain-containing (lipo)protein [Arthrobacter sp. Z4-13]
MKKILTWLSALLMAVGVGLLAPGPASAATSYCGLQWGSLAKAGPHFSTASVTNVRTGQHTCFDRTVIDLKGPVKGYTVGYVTDITQDGSGAIIPVRGGARLQLTLKAPAYDAHGNATYSPRNRTELSNVSGYQTFRQVVYAGSFEGYTSVGLGVRARLPFRVLTLDGPGSGSRLIVDVAHFW